jgi:hypothetical protein
MKIRKITECTLGQNRGRMFILAGFSQLLGMLIFRALQVLKWFDFPVVSYVDAKLVCQLTKIKLVIFDDKHRIRYNTENEKI